MALNLFYCPICYGNETDYDDEDNEACVVCGWPVDEFVPWSKISHKVTIQGEALKAAVEFMLDKQELEAEERAAALGSLEADPWGSDEDGQSS